MDGTSTRPAVTAAAIDPTDPIAAALGLPPWLTESWLLEDVDPVARERRILAASWALAIPSGILLFLLLAWVLEPRIPNLPLLPPVTVHLVSNKSVSPSEPAQPLPSPRPAESPTPPEPRRAERVPHPVPNPARTPPQPALPAPTPEPPRQFDMMAAVQQARAHREAVDAYAQQVEAAAQAAERAPSQDQLAMQRIKSNLKWAEDEGKTSGLFTVMSVGIREGTFSFLGWTRNENDATKQVVNVDAGAGGDVHLAMVRRMIDIIREHYTGDFNWESHRCGIVTESARPQDQAELERFMLSEFDWAPPVRCPMMR